MDEAKADLNVHVRVAVARGGSLELSAVPPHLSSTAGAIGVPE